MATKRTKAGNKEIKSYFPQGTEVMTPDGKGKTIGMNSRFNTNGGPGAKQYIVQLDDGRIRHYPLGDVKLAFFTVEN